MSEYLNVPIKITVKRVEDGWFDGYIDIMRRRFQFHVGLALSAEAFLQAHFLNQCTEHFMYEHSCIVFHDETINDHAIVKDVLFQIILPTVLWYAYNIDGYDAGIANLIYYDDERECEVTAKDFQTLAKALL